MHPIAIAHIAALTAVAPLATAAAQPLSTGVTASYGRRAVSGVFTVLTYNLAAVPFGFTKHDPSTNLPQVGPRLKRFDLVLLQEDFEHHSILRAHTDLPFMTIPRQTILPDGLTHMAKWPLGPVQRVAWRACFGYLNFANDCLSRKGLSVASVRIHHAFVLHAYNHHADAAGSVGDFETRADNFAQLISALRRSRDMPVIVAGDTNLNVAQKEDRETYQRFTQQTGLVDVCARVSCDGEWIDRIFYRSSQQIELEPLSWQIVPGFVDAQGRDLSDHKPIAATFRWRRR